MIQFYFSLYIEPIFSSLSAKESFSHSFVDGHLDCFHVVATVKSAAVNMDLFELQLCLVICLGLGLQVRKGKINTI